MALYFMIYDMFLQLISVYETKKPQYFDHHTAVNHIYDLIHNYDNNLSFAVYINVMNEVDIKYHHLDSSYVSNIIKKVYDSYANLHSKDIFHIGVITQNYKLHPNVSHIVHKFLDHDSIYLGTFCQNHQNLIPIDNIPDNLSDSLIERLSLLCSIESSHDSDGPSFDLLVLLEYIIKYMKYMYYWDNEPQIYNIGDGRLDITWYNLFFTLDYNKMVLWLDGDTYITNEVKFCLPDNMKLEIITNILMIFAT
jgi:hypothetical protein